MKTAQVAIHTDEFVWICPRGTPSVYVYSSADRDPDTCSGKHTSDYADTPWSEDFHTVINDYPRSLL